MLNDLISDALTRIRNASLRRLDTTKLLHSKSVEAIARILTEKEYLESYNVVEEDNKKFINVVLKYDENGRSVINELTRVSKPSRRLYQGKDEIKRPIVKDGKRYTILIIISIKILPLKGTLYQKNATKKHINIEPNAKNRYGISFAIIISFMLIGVAKRASIVPLSHSLVITKAVKSVLISVIITAIEPGIIKYLLEISELNLI